MRKTFDSETEIYFKHLIIMLPDGSQMTFSLHLEQ